MIRRVLLLLVFVSLLTAACSPPTAVVDPTLVQVTPLATETPITPEAATSKPEPTATSEPTATPEPPALWLNVTKDTIGNLQLWTNKVELADIDGDGLVDILFANGGNYDRPGLPLMSQVLLNRGPDAMFENVSEQVLGSTGMLARVIKVRDVNSDGLADIMVGTTFQTQSRLYLGEGDGQFVDVTQTYLPELVASVGDLEFGDVDADGDLDVLLADWGVGSPMASSGGRTLLWLNDGAGHFTDVTAEQMPEALVKFSWELEFVDVDNDYDLDIVVSCKRCTGYMFENDSSGLFTDVTRDRLPPRLNNYEFEAMDVNGDMFLDLVTINNGYGNLQDGLLLNVGPGNFEAAPDDLWPDEYNPDDADDNMVAFLDFESDGDADFLIGSLSHADRILINDGQGHLSLLDAPKLLSPFSGGTLGIAVADLNGDHRLDIVEAQGETSFDDRVYYGQTNLPDVAPPVITLVTATDDDPAIVHARVHDNKSPTMPHDWQSVVVRWSTAGGQSGEVPMQWYGEYLWRAALDDSVPAGAAIEVCATDAAGNEACAAAE